MIITFEKKLGSLLNEKNLEIIEINREKINANGVLVLSQHKSYIFLSVDLNYSTKIFVCLHELGHIKLSYLSNNPNTKYSEEIEKKCDAWAIQTLEPFISKITFNKLNNLINNQRSLYEYISKSFELYKLYKFCEGSIFKNKSRSHIT